MGARHHALHHLFEEADKFAPKIRNILSSIRRSPWWDRNSDGRTTAPTPPAFSTASSMWDCGPTPTRPGSRLHSHQSGSDRGPGEKIRGFSWRDLQLHAAGRRRRGRSSHRTQERAGRQDFRSRSRGSGEQSRRDQAGAGSYPGFSELTVVRELGQPSLTVTPTARRSRATASMSTTWEPWFRRGRRPDRDPGHPGREALRPRGTQDPQFRSGAARSATCWCRRPPASRFRYVGAGRHQRPAARPLFIAKIIRATLESSFRWWAEISKASSTPVRPR